MAGPAHHTSAPPPPPAVYVRPLRWGPPGEDIDSVEREAAAGQRVQREQLRAQAPVPGPPYDLIVGSDLIYYTYSEETPHSKLLLWTLARISTPKSLIYLALSLHHNPEEVEHFLSMASSDFEVSRLTHEVPREWRVHDSLVVRLRLKETSAVHAGGRAAEAAVAGEAGSEQAGGSRGGAEAEGEGGEGGGQADSCLHAA
ncbi:hypothetical protein FOA52_007859 [Chlamydomonas sp. UWO 241]|nr:hypothetical protein FOA52_007859 [Chlamydomonas sp. UWO 241]